MLAFCVFWKWCRLSFRIGPSSRTSTNKHAFINEKITTSFSLTTNIYEVKNLCFLHTLEIGIYGGGSSSRHVQVCGKQISSAARKVHPPPLAEPKGRLKWSETINLKPVIGGELCWYTFPMTSSLQKALECCPARPSSPDGGDDGQADALFFTSDGITGGLLGSAGERRDRTVTLFFVLTSTLFFSVN